MKKDKEGKKWEAQLYHGGKREHLGHFATEEDAKARYDGRCLELGMDPDAATSSGVCGVSWDKKSSKWRATIRIDGKSKHLGYFEATARGEVDAALAHDAAARAEGRPEKANFELNASSGVKRAKQSAVTPPPTVVMRKGTGPTTTAAETEQVQCVQCDRCGKWRELADVDVLPDKWFCELNADQEYGSCEVVEQEWGDDKDAAGQSAFDGAAPRLYEDYDPLPAIGEKRAFEQSDDSSAATGRGEIQTSTDTSSTGAAAASPRSPPNKKARQTDVTSKTGVAAAPKPPVLAAADVLDRWLVQAPLPTELRCAQHTTHAVSDPAQ